MALRCLKLPAALRNELSKIDEDIQQLQEDFSQRKGEAAVLQRDLEVAEQTLNKADGLMSKMSGEKDRWEYQVSEIQRDAALLSTHTCLSAAYCTYLGHFSEDVRQQASLSRLV